VVDRTRAQNINICEILGAYNKFLLSSTAVIRDNECGIVVLVMFEFKLKKMSHRAITCGQWRASGDTGSVRKVPLYCLATYSIKNTRTRIL
jgi:hypothetical protein